MVHKMSTRLATPRSRWLEVAVLAREGNGPVH